MKYNGCDITQKFLEGRYLVTADGQLCVLQGKKGNVTLTAGVVVKKAAWSYKPVFLQSKAFFSILSFKF